MTKFQSFLDKYNNKFVEKVDPSSPFQCYDLVVAWLDELGIPRQPGGGSIFPFQFAYQIYSKFGDLQAKYFDRFPNDPYALVKEGDIVVWSYTYNGGAGHTAIATGEGDLYNFKAFQQNDPESWFASKNSHVRNYKYNYVLGWLRPKELNLPVTCEQRLNKVKDTLLKQGVTDTQRVQLAKKELGIA